MLVCLWINTGVFEEEVLLGLVGLHVVQTAVYKHKTTITVRPSKLASII